MLRKVRNEIAKTPFSKLVLVPVEKKDRSSNPSINGESVWIYNPGLKLNYAGKNAYKINGDKRSFVKWEVPFDKELFEKIRVGSVIALRLIGKGSF